MNKNDEINIELAKNKSDEFVIKKELEFAKNNFINDLENGLGNEIKKINVYDLNVPVKYKKPFKLKVKDFLKKINKVLGL